MIIFKHSAEIHSFLLSKKNDQAITGFIPTMGALHEGHIGLVKRARNDTHLVVSSIFVNPTQFNDPRDFEKYPSTIEKDVYLLEKAGCDILFIPAIDDIYPDGIKSTRHYDLGYLETVLEGKFRPGHFQGVCQVVNRLLDIVMPSRLYLGQKDYQQCMILNKMIKLLQLQTEIIICNTHREPDGLAMSSRNLRLNETDRKKAPGLFEVLRSIKKNIRAGNTEHLTRGARLFLIEEGFKVDYVEIADGVTLEILKKWDGKSSIVALAAAFLDEVRLIDNIII